MLHVLTMCSSTVKSLANAQYLINTHPLLLIQIYVNFIQKSVYLINAHPQLLAQIYVEGWWAFARDFMGHIVAVG